MDCCNTEKNSHQGHKGHTGGHGMSHGSAVQYLKRFWIVTLDSSCASAFEGLGDFRHYVWSQQMDTVRNRHDNFRICARLFPACVARNKGTGVRNDDACLTCRRVRISFFRSFNFYSYTSCRVLFRNINAYMGALVWALLGS
jgi:hypothetical protein